MSPWYDLRRKKAPLLKQGFPLIRRYLFNITWAPNFGRVRWIRPVRNCCLCPQAFAECLRSKLWAGTTRNSRSAVMHWMTRLLDIIILCKGPHNTLSWLLQPRCFIWSYYQCEGIHVAVGGALPVSIFCHASCLRSMEIRPLHSNRAPVWTNRNRSITLKPNAAEQQVFVPVGGKMESTAPSESVHTLHLGNHFDTRSETSWQKTTPRCS